MREVYDYLMRYGLVAILGALALEPLYWFLTPLTVQTVKILISTVTSVTLLGETTLYIKGEYISLVPACIAGAAYYLLLICACTIPLTWKERGKVLGISWGLLFVFNVIRILGTTYLATTGNSLFTVTHAFFWYAGSTVMVILCWILTTTYCKIQTIPFVTDLTALYAQARGNQ
jgi:exosortase/archaeosortase family protein